MTLTRPLVRLLAAAGFGVAAFVPAAVLPGASPAGADPGDMTTPTTDPCHELGTCPEPPPPVPCLPGHAPIPTKGGGTVCVPCEGLPPGFLTCPAIPECDPAVEDCDEPPVCDPAVEDCDQPPDCDPAVEECETDPRRDPDPVDPPVTARPTFTG